MNGTSGRPTTGRPATLAVAPSARAVAVVLLAVTAVLIAVVVLAAVVLMGAVALAADPSMAPVATSLGLLEGGDPRSEGGVPGLAGSPLLVLLGVVALGIVTTLVTILLARLSQRR